MIVNTGDGGEVCEDLVGRKRVLIEAGVGRMREKSKVQRKGIEDRNG